MPTGRIETIASWYQPLIKRPGSTLACQPHYSNQGASLLRYLTSPHHSYQGATCATLSAPAYAIKYKLCTEPVWSVPTSLASLLLAMSAKTIGAS